MKKRFNRQLSILGVQLACFLLVWGSWSLAQDVVKKSPAEKYLDAVGFDKYLLNYVEIATEGMSAGQKETYLAFFKNKSSKDEVRNRVILLLDEIFEEEHLEALVKFYGGKVGQDIQKRMPQFLAKMNPAMEEVIQEEFAKYLVQPEPVDQGQAGGED